MAAREILTLKEAGEYLRVNRVTLSKLLQRGQLPAFKIGRQWRFRRDRLDKWLYQQEKNHNKKIKQ